MIPQRHITQWTTQVGWTQVNQVEQDLLLSRLIVEIANDEYLGDELVFRGGTCLHKLRLSPGLRYSEDLDYVRRSPGPIKEMAVALRAIGERLGMQVNVDISKYPKVRFRAPFATGTATMRIKVEVNTYERSPAQPLEHVAFNVQSDWFTGSAEVLTFSASELVATKIRALYQRSKGRDLFDLWVALTKLGLSPDAILGAFGPYRPEGLTSALSIANLETKLTKPDFRNDLAPLIASSLDDYDPDMAARLVIDKLLTHIK
jgi:predicted nucleotidyltransferase component of viral defense system